MHVFVQNDDEVWGAPLDGRMFGTPSCWGGVALPGFIPCANGGTCKRAAVHGDGNADLVAFAQGTTNDVCLARSTGRSFTNSMLVDTNFGESGEPLEVADVNGDSRAEFIKSERAAPYDVQVAVWVDDEFVPNPPELWGADLSRPKSLFRLGDYDGDARADLLAFER